MIKTIWLKSFSILSVLSGKWSIHLMTGNSSSLWKTQKSWLYLCRFVFLWPLFACQITYEEVSHFLWIWLLEMSLYNFKDPCWLSQHHRYFSRDELRIPCQPISQISKYVLTSEIVLFFWLLRYFVHVLRAFTNWILLIKSIPVWLENRKDMNGQSLCKYFYHRKSRYFLIIMKNDRTGGHINVTIEPLLAPQSFLNMPLGSFCQNQWYLFLLSLSLCFHHMLSFKCLNYIVMLSETMTEERCYRSLDLTVHSNYRHVSY